MGYGIVVFVVGGLAVWLGAEGMVRGAVRLAKYLGVSQPSLARLTSEGKVPLTRRVGSHARYQLDDLRRAKADLGPAH